MTPDASRTSRGPNNHATSAPPSRPPAWPLCRQGSKAGTGCWCGKSRKDRNHSVSSSALALQAGTSTSLVSQVPATAAASLTSCLCASTSGCRPRLWPASCPAAAAQPHCAAPCCACGASRTRPGRHPGQTEQLQADKGRRGTTHAKTPSRSAHGHSSTCVCLCVPCHSSPRTHPTPTPTHLTPPLRVRVSGRSWLLCPAGRSHHTQPGSGCGLAEAQHVALWWPRHGCLSATSWWERQQDNNHLGQQLPSLSTSPPPASADTHILHQHAAQPLPAARKSP